MNILLRPNFQKAEAVSATKKIIEKLISLGMNPLISTENAKQLGTSAGCKVGKLDVLLKNAELLMPIGGDGTVLNELTNAIRNNLPIMGINAGRIGFLTQLEISELDELIRLKEEKYKISSRMLLSAKVVKKESKKEYYALNDIVFKRVGHDATILDISVYEDKDRIIHQRADGIIFSTPTGSTAYSLSAGGPILSPNMDGIILSSICPHNTFRGSIVLSSEGEYTAFEEQKYHCNTWGFSVGVDGNWLEYVDKGEQVIIGKHDKRLLMIDLGIRNFYKNLNNKLSFMY